HEVLAEVELPAKAPQQVDLGRERFRLAKRPRHPGAKVVEARVDRALEQRRIRGLPAAYDQPLGDDPVRRRLQNSSSSRRAAAATRSADGMYQSSSCQYGYGTSKPVTRTIGPRRSRIAFSASTAASSAANPATRGASCTITTRP